MPARPVSAANASRSSAKPFPSAGPRAMTITSHPGATGSSLTMARNRRLSRFRTTALPRRLPTAKPKRLLTPPFGRTRRARRGDDHDLPLRYASAKSDRRRSRCSGCTWGFGLHRKALPPLLTARAEHIAATGRAHARPEPVLALARNTLRLIGALRHGGLLASILQRVYPHLRFGVNASGAR